MQPIDSDTFVGVDRSVRRERSNGSYKILVIDDQPLARRGLALTIESEDDLRVCCECGCAEQVMQDVDSRTPDLAVVDLSLGTGAGMDVIRTLHISKPNMPILVISAHDDPLHAAHAMRAGARGYLSRSEDAETVVVAIRRLLRGGVFVSDALNEKLLLGLASDPDALFLSPPEVLSRRELQVFELTGRGLSTSDIAGRLKVSVKTIESYRHRIKTKLHLHSATELVQHAVRWVDGERGL